MKFSELLGEPERDQDATTPEPEAMAPPPAEAEPISVFAPVPVTAPAPATGIEYPDDPPPAPVAPPVVTAPRTGLAEVNVRHEAAEVPTEENETTERLAGLDLVVDDLLPSTYQRRGRR